MQRMKIVHMSDWHSGLKAVPEADLYICTGDMLPNYPTLEGRIVPEWEQHLQEEWIEKILQRGSARMFLRNKDAPVVVVRGNHDFTDLGPLFGGEVYEIGVEPTVYDVLGLKIGGIRGIPFIEGVWSDEIDNETLKQRMDHMPYVDILCTHAPPAGVLDGGLGSPAFAQYLNKQYYMDREVKLHCFGHIHECYGKYDAGTVFSNAATGINTIVV